MKRQRFPSPRAATYDARTRPHTAAPPTHLCLGRCLCSLCSYLQLLTRVGAHPAGALARVLIFVTPGAGRRCSVALPSWSVVCLSLMLLAWRTASEQGDEPWRVTAWVAE